MSLPCSPSQRAPELPFLGCPASGWGPWVTESVPASQSVQAIRGQPFTPSSRAYGGLLSPRPQYFPSWCGAEAATHCPGGRCIQRLESEDHETDASGTSNLVPSQEPVFPGDNGTTGKHSCCGSVQLQILGLRRISDGILAQLGQSPPRPCPRPRITTRVLRDDKKLSPRTLWSTPSPRGP